MNRKHLSLLGLTLVTFLAFTACKTPEPIVDPVPLETDEIVQSEIPSDNPLIKPVFLTPEEGARALSKEDTYIKVLSAYDYAAKFKSEKVLSETERLTYFSDKTMTFTAGEKQRISHAMTILNEKLAPLELNVPTEVNFIKTNGLEEGGAAYTRDENIILPEQMLGMSGKSFDALIAHEFFHVYTRYNTEHRSELYELIGFQAAESLKYPEEIVDLRISNPDAPDVRYFVTDIYKDKKMSFIPIIYSSEPYDISQNTSFFQTMEMKMLGVELDGDQLIPLYENDKAILVDLFDLPNVYKNTGENTDYVIHPEEILADNFALYVVGGKINNQWVIDDLINKMQSID